MGPQHRRPLCLGAIKAKRWSHLKEDKRLNEFTVLQANNLINAYVKRGSMVDARHIFDAMPIRDVVSWNIMILGYAKHEEGAQALEFYTRMRQEGVLPSDRTFVSAFKACSSLAALEGAKKVDGKFAKIQWLETGRTIHSQVVTSGFESDVFVGTTLVDVYVKCGSLEDAKRIFEKLPRRDVFAWTSMILGYAEQEESEEAFRLYAQMQEKGLSPDSIAFVAILKACGSKAALETGKVLHSGISRVGFETIASVANSLIGMYAKCGSMVDAQLLFDMSLTRDTVTWTALIAGYAHQGESELVFNLFERMRQDGVQPNRVTFLTVLIVCSHVGLEDKGQKYLQAMKIEYGISPTIEHYTCMVDLLSRTGRVEEAVAMVEKMPCEPNVVIWLTVLSACRKWKNVEVGRHAFEKVVRLNKKLPAGYVLMANIYADAQMMEDCDRIELMRKKAQAGEKAGESWCMDLSRMLLSQRGFVPDLEHLQDVCDDDKQDTLLGHSEEIVPVVP